MKSLEERKKFREDLKQQNQTDAGISAGKSEDEIAGDNGDIDKMTVPQLQSYAAANGYTIPGDVTRSADIKQYLKNAKTAREQNGGENGEGNGAGWTGN